MLSRIYKCNESPDHTDDIDILGKCINTNVKVIKKIGKGTFGTVYLIEYKGMQCAVKIIINKINNNSEQIIDIITDEVNYNYFMSSMNIGPEIYDAFYTIGKEYVKCYILMETFDSSVDVFITRSDISDETFIDVNKQMLDLLYKQIFESKLYCTDIKPGNYVIKTSGDNYIVRLIDFGNDYCSMDKLPTSYKNSKIFYMILLIQLCLMIRSDNDNIKIMIPFIEDPIFKKYIDSTEFPKVLLRVLDNCNVGYIHRHYFKMFYGDYDNDELCDFIITDMKTLRDNVHNNQVRSIGSRKFPKYRITKSRKSRKMKK